MTYKSSYLFTATGLLLAAFLFSSQAFAAGRITHQDEAVEADKVEVFIPKDSQTGSARVTGCSRCPLRLNIDGATRFYYKGEPASPQRVTFLSGKPGTVIYDNEQQRVLSIRW